MIACQTLYMKNLLILELKRNCKSKDSMMKSALSIFVRKNKNYNSQPILVASSIKLTDYSVKEMKVDKMSKSE